MSLNDIIGIIGVVVAVFAWLFPNAKEYFQSNSPNDSSADLQKTKVEPIAAWNLILTIIGILVAIVAWITPNISKDSAQSSSEPTSSVASPEVQPTTAAQTKSISTNPLEVDSHGISSIDNLIIDQKEVNVETALKAAKEARDIYAIAKNVEEEALNTLLFAKNAFAKAEANASSPIPGYKYEDDGDKIIGSQLDVEDGNYGYFLIKDKNGPTLAGRGSPGAEIGYIIMSNNDFQDYEIYHMEKTIEQESERLFVRRASDIVIWGQALSPDDRLTGIGVIEFDDGSRYEGSWEVKDDTRNEDKWGINNGLGIWYSPNGTSTAGLWWTR